MNDIFNKLFIALLLGTLLAIPATAAQGPVTTRLILPSTQFAPGKSYPVLLEATIDGKYHINSQTPRNPALIATKTTFTVSDARVAVGRVDYPEAEFKKFSFSPEKLNVFEGTIYIATSLSFSEGVEGSVTVTALLEYQACTDVACLLPEEVTAVATLTIGTEGTPLEEALFTQHADRVMKAGGGDDLLTALRGSVGLTAFFLVFLGGLALNLTPCVYPMIPITVGYFGGATGRTKGETFIHSLVYLFGMAIMYSVIGVIAAVTGSLFGELMQNSFVILMLVGVMLALALSMFGVWEITMPRSLTNLSMKNYGGMFGTFFMGLTVGIVAAPCVGPFVIGLLTFVSERQDVLLGFALFFTLALGLGLPLVVLANFSGAIGYLPRSGVWLTWVSRFFGIVLVGMALYFAQPLLPKGSSHILYLVLAFAGGAYLIHAGKDIGGAVFNTFRYGIGFGMMFAGLVLYSLADTKTEGLAFVTYSKPTYENALRDKKPVVIDFTADWCLPCQELKVFTFTDPMVKKRAGDFAAMEVDLTRVNADLLAIKKEFGVLGVPTVLFIDPDGKEVHRVTGFITAEEFLGLLDSLTEKKVSFVPALYPATG